MPFAKTYSGAVVLMEAGGNSPWVARELVKYGWKVTVAKADVLCGRKRRKTDATDATDAAELAELARLQSTRIVAIEHQPEDIAADAVFLTMRDALVRARTGFWNTVQGVLKSAGVTIPSHCAESLPKRLKPIVPAPLKAAVRPMLDLLVTVNARIAACDKAIRRLVREKYPQAKRFSEQVLGVSDVVALAFVLTVFRHERFRRARDIGPYLGLEPHERSSGTLKPQLGISKTGNGFLRKLLVQSAHYLLGPWAKDNEEAGDLREWGMALMKRGGKASMKRAAVAVARRLAVAMLATWKSGADWDPHFTSRKRKPAALEAPPKTGTD